MDPVLIVILTVVFIGMCFVGSDLRAHQRERQIALDGYRRDEALAIEASRRALRRKLHQAKMAGCESLVRELDTRMNELSEQTEKLSEEVAEAAVDAEFAKIFQTLETGESDLPGLFKINGEPTELERKLEIGPVMAIRLNERLILDIQALWDAKKADERKARLQAIQKRQLRAREIRAERKFKWWHRRALRGLCCADCFGDHPTGICVADRFRARRMPHSTMAPYDEKLGMFGHYESRDDLVASDARRFVSPHTGAEHSQIADRQYMVRKRRITGAEWAMEQAERDRRDQVRRAKMQRRDQLRAKRSPRASWY